MSQSSILSVYRWFFSYVTGRDCRAKVAAFRCRNAAYFAGVLMLEVTGANIPGSALAQIEMPDPPMASPPPAIPRERDPVQIRKRERDAKELIEQEKVQDKIDHAADVKREEIAKKEQETPRIMRGFVELSALYPTITTSGSRKKYHADITTHINIWGRLKPGSEEDTPHMWAGFRVAPFGGYGTQSGQKGRFNMTYFGPGLGIGSISKGPAFSGDDSAPTRNGWLFSFGISPVSRLQNNSENPTNDATDFKGTPWSIDNPGLWFEARTLHIFRGALSGDLLAGAQLAEGKNFLYFGVGFAGWL